MDHTHILFYFIYYNNLLEVNLNIFNKNLTLVNIVNYFLELIKKVLVNNIFKTFKNDQVKAKFKYSIYINMKTVYTKVNIIK